ncbi:unnamed protein product [Spirodela intermedia]|uniref:RING-type E3 ubiquitin transferase n=1 Tax=Spirodela intermedia TaxID=51605 RepID=A0A7I8IUY5_SPIIN|nr:unnamed protein product [Spirodela intermedia]CAA6661383.1 unnamed protein product [Spirodela intermedia]
MPCFTPSCPLSPVLAPMCRELSNIMDMIIPIVPSIESARPGGTSGIQELCSLNNEIEKTNLLLQHCAESSNFYLAMTREAITLRCERRRNALHESLRRIQTMVPEPLSAQVATIVVRLRAAKFNIDPAVEEAGKAILSLLQQNNSTENAEFEAFCNAASKLDITTPRALLLERRSIKKLFDKLSVSDPRKEKILQLLYLFRKYEKRFGSENFGHQIDRSDVFIGSSVAEGKNASESNSCEAKNEASEWRTGVIDCPEDQNDLSADSPPKEFRCPLSLELMYDPVVIASGQTYERASIAKWFREGHDMCPRTGMKITNFAMVPNSCMKMLISSWCKKHGISMPNPGPRSNDLEAFHSWDNSNSSSIVSMNISAPTVGGRIADLDYSNLSILSSDGSCYSDSSFVRNAEGLNDSHSSSQFSQDVYLKFFSVLSELTLESQTKALADFKARLSSEEARQSMLSNGFVDALVQFLKDAYHLSNLKSQKMGSQLLLAFLGETRLEDPCINDDAFELLISFLDSEIAHEALMILQIICRHPSCESSIVLPGVRPLMKILDSGATEFPELVLDILCNLSSSIEGKHQILNGRLAGNCLKLMHSLCEVEEGKVAIAETDGCITAIVELLDSGSREEQEHSVAILLSLCSYCTEYCSLVMKEGIIPSLVHVSINGNSQGKDSSMKLLHVLRTSEMMTIPRVRSLTLSPVQSRLRCPVDKTRGDNRCPGDQVS